MRCGFYYCWLNGGHGRALTGELLRKRFCRDIVDRAGDALHVEFALLEQGQQLLVVHADLLGEFVYADAHSVVRGWRKCSVRLLII
jgi:hypothetical protein